MNGCSMKNIFAILLMICLLSGFAAAGEIPRWMVLTLQGEELTKAGKFEQGLDFFLQAERIQKNSTRLYMNLAVCYKILSEKAASSVERKEHYFKFIAYVQNVLRLDPLHADARYFLDKHLGIIPEPIPFKKAEAREFYRAGRDGLKGGSLEAALELFKKALAAEQHPDILKSLAVISFQKEDLEKTAQLLHKSIKLNPVQHDAYMILGEISERKNRLNEAKLFYIKALASYPNYFPAREKISLVNKKMGKEGTFFFLMDPVPQDKREISPDDEITIRRLAQEIKVNIFQLQCWLVYHQAIRSAKDTQKKELPKVLFEVTADIETQAVGMMLDYYAKHKEKMGVNLKHFDILASLKNKNLLKAAVFFYRWRDGFSREFVRYRKNHFDDFCRMFEEHL